MTYLEATISEVMRHASIVPLGVPHSTSEDVSFAGYVIPKGAYVIVRLDTALHDPEVWQEPDKFRPERFIGADGKLLRPEGFIPFSTGTCTQWSSSKHIARQVFVLCGEVHLAAVNTTRHKHLT